VKETRIFAAPVEVREQADDTATIVGYGAVFSNEYEVAGFTESVSPRAFERTLKKNGDHAVVWSHDPARVLGTQQSGTARFEIDERGLRYEADLDLRDPDGMSAYRKIVSGKVRQSSFSFEVKRDKWEEREDAPPHRTLVEVRLWETSPVLWGANPATEVDVQRAARSLAEITDTDTDALEAALAEGTLVDVLHPPQATAETPADAPPPAPVDPSPPEPTAVEPIITKGLNG
jgi:hypothetical protein